MVLSGAAAVRTTSAVDACADAVRRAILEGDITPGERLPPERALAERLGVNRVTLRSALGRLAQERLVSVRQGSGYVVLDYRRSGGPDLIAELVAVASARARREVVEDLLLVRRQLARAVLERLARGVSVAHRRRIAVAIDAFAARVAEGAAADALADADAAVMTAVVEATGSVVLELCLNPVLGVARGLPALRDAIYADAAASVAAWRALAAWLERPSPEVVDAVSEALAARDADTLARLARPATKTRRRKR